MHGSTRVLSHGILFLRHNVGCFFVPSLTLSVYLSCLPIYFCAVSYFNRLVPCVCVCVCFVVVALGQYECYDNFFIDQGLTNDQIDDFVEDCLDCESEDYTHYSILFNAFVFAQIFNEFNARSIFDEWNVLKGMSKNLLFMAIIFITIGLQVLYCALPLGKCMCSCSYCGVIILENRWSAACSGRCCGFSLSCLWLGWVG